MSGKGAKKKLAVITTHPIQYHAPLYALLVQRGVIDIKVFYTWGESVLKDKFDPGFGKVIEWDIPLLKGYPYEFLENTADDKGSHHFNGIKNPGLIEAVDQYNPDAILIYGWS
ncbi:MAG TPA: glycosyl transferase family 1, partial [Chitinophagaceae bacterium]|nr:glycosyl transferase family 1 [Chitinophagaceae bacterium]